MEIPSHEMGERENEKKKRTDKSDWVYVLYRDTKIKSFAQN